MAKITLAEAEFGLNPETKKVFRTISLSIDGAEPFALVGRTVRYVLSDNHFSLVPMPEDLQVVSLSGKSSEHADKHGGHAAANGLSKFATVIDTSLPDESIDELLHLSIAGALIASGESFDTVQGMADQIVEATDKVTEILKLSSWDRSRLEAVARALEDAYQRGAAVLADGELDEQTAEALSDQGVRILDQH